jgi:hypothetical protein
MVWLLVLVLLPVLMLLVLLLSPEEWAGFSLGHRVLLAGVMHWGRQRRRGREVGGRIILVHFMGEGAEECKGV